jgi:multiple sugar transport system substrate-binding protein
METGTDFLGISKFSHHKALALEFLQFLLSKQMQEVLYYKFHDFPVLRSVYTDILSNSSLTQSQRQELQTIYQYAQVAYANPPNIPPTYSYLIPTFNGQVYNYLTGQNTNATQVLQSAAESWVKYLG